MEYTLKGIKEFRGMEGHGFNATLIGPNSKPVAFVMDDGNGGMISFDFSNPKQTRKSFEESRENANDAELMFGIWVEEYYAREPNDEEFMGASRHSKMESWMYHEIDLWHERRTMERQQRTKTLFRLKDQKYKNGEWNTVKIVYGPEAQRWLDKHYPGKVASIYGQGEGGAK